LDYTSPLLSQNQCIAEILQHPVKQNMYELWNVLEIKKSRWIIHFNKELQYCGHERQFYTQLLGKAVHVLN
jgi:hypothetical protein